MFLNHSRVGAPAWQIAHEVRRGDTTAVAVTADHLDHARVADRVLAAFRALRAAEVLAEAEMVDDQADLGALSLAGVPVVVPDDTPVAGVSTWHGSAAAPPDVADRDHEVVRRLRGAGALILGVARGSEFGLWPARGDEPVTRNPWRADRGPGEGAGGVAASVAAGVVPLGLAADRFGALRVPAASCGLIALCPGVGSDRVLRRAADRDADEYGLLATTAADLALGHAVVSGGRNVLPPAPGRLRVAVSGRTPWLAMAARCLVESGHDVRSARPPYLRLLPATAVAAWAEQAYHEQAHHESVTIAGTIAGSPPNNAPWQPRSRRLAALGRVVARRGPSPSLRIADLGRRIRAWFTDGGWDLVVAPALGGPPPLAGVSAVRTRRISATTVLGAGSSALAWSLTGLPALVLPLGVRRDGIPAAVQLIGPPGTELRLVALAAQWEQARQAAAQQEQTRPDLAHRRTTEWPARAPGWPRPQARWRRGERSAMLPAVVGLSGHDR